MSTFGLISSGANGFATLVTLELAAMQPTTLSSFTMHRLRDWKAREGKPYFQICYESHRSPALHPGL